VSGSLSRVGRRRRSEWMHVNNVRAYLDINKVN
jgi:hypothetical protein